jgi:hypothetical protein
LTRLDPSIDQELDHMCGSMASACAADHRMAAVPDLLFQGEEEVLKASREPL